ncbi:MAG TPA: amidohydrolase [Desulfosporosinus sp.]|nr:amidohydrolase [Desulfosporosinus sp.]
MIHKLKRDIASVKEEVIRIRRDLHMHPELGFQEFRTSKLICEYLESLGIETQVLAQTGIVGLLQGGQPGPTLLLRADMDALPLQELIDKPYKSIYEGIAHSCGHDSHVAILLGAAKVLSNSRHEIKGNIKFLFQPNEETTYPKGGALEMIRNGVLENPRVDGAFALHVWSGIDSGKIGVVSGAIMAGLEEFELTIFGKGGHTSSPHSAVDPIIAAAKIVDAVQTISTREIDVFNPTVIMFGKIQGGTGRNIIPEKVEMGGTMRYLFDDEEEGKALLKEKFERIIKGICMASRTEYELTYIPSNPSMNNAPEMVQMVREAALETLGIEQSIIQYRVMGGEDFAEFTHRVPSAFYFVGTRNLDKGSDYPHHHPLFDIDEETLLIGVEMHVRSALAYLNK